MKDLSEFEVLWREGHYNIEDEEIGSRYKSENNIENKFSFINQGLQEFEVLK